MTSKMSDLEQSCAQVWDMPEIMLDSVEQGRHPFTAPLSKIVGAAASRHIAPGATILEIGAGSGYLRDLLPVGHQQNLISTDYNYRNLRAGMTRRQLSALACSAYELPFKDKAVDCVVNLDAFDTLPSLDKAMAESMRVLKTGGKFMHFQVNRPSDDMLDYDYPDLTWLPHTKIRHHESSAVGVNRDELTHILNGAMIPESWRIMMQDLIGDKLSRLKMEDHEESDILIDIVDEITAEFGLSQTIIPSIQEYFRSKLEQSARNAGMAVVESAYIMESSAMDQEPDDDYGSCQLVLGRVSTRAHTGILSGEKVWRIASMMVFVAQKN